MSGGFNNPVVGGSGVLVVPAIHSVNYVPGTSGWTINRDGSAEFSDVVIRGEVVIGAAPHSRIITQTIPTTVFNYYVANYAATVTAIDIKSIDASQYAYEVLLSGSSTYVKATGQVIINSNTLAEEVFEETITTIATDDSVTIQPIRIITGNPTDLTRFVQLESIDATKEYYNSVRRTIADSDDDALTGGPFNLTNASQLSNCAVTYKSKIASVAQPATWEVIGVFDFSVSAVVAGGLCEGELDHNGTIQAALALMAMDQVTRNTVTQIWRGTITNRNNHTFTLGYLKNVAGGAAQLHAVHTNILLRITETLG